MLVVIIIRDPYESPKQYDYYKKDPHDSELRLKPNSGKGVVYIWRGKGIYLISEDE
jgi:hypothetical protein